MRVLVDALSVAPGGGATVASGLLFELGGLAADDQYTVLVKDPLLPMLRCWPDNVRFVPVGRFAAWPAVRTIWEQACLPARIESGAYDLLFGLGGFGLLRGGHSQVVVVQNALFYATDIEWTIRQRVRIPLQREVQLAALRRGATGVCVGQAVRDRLRGYVGDQARLVVIPNGVESTVARRDPSRYRDSSNPVILWVGSAAVHKNPAELVEAISYVEKRRRCGVELRFAGAISEGDRITLVRQANQLGLSSSLVFCGFLSRQELILEYRNATLFVSTSRIEASPLPPVEALANGTPTILTSIDAHLEIAPDAPTYRAGDPVGLAGQIARLLDDPTLRSQYAGAGLAIARTRTWRAAAEAYRREFDTATGSCLGGAHRPTEA